MKGIWIIFLMFWVLGCSTSYLNPYIDKYTIEKITPGSERMISTQAIFQVKREEADFTILWVEKRKVIQEVTITEVERKNYYGYDFGIDLIETFLPPITMLTALIMPLIWNLEEQKTYCKEWRERGAEGVPGGLPLNLLASIIPGISESDGKNFMVSEKQLSQKKENKEAEKDIPLPGQYVQVKLMEQNVAELETDAYGKAKIDLTDKIYALLRQNIESLKISFSSNKEFKNLCLQKEDFPVILTRFKREKEERLAMERKKEEVRKQREEERRRLENERRRMREEEERKQRETEEAEREAEEAEKIRLAGVYLPQEKEDDREGSLNLYFETDVDIEFADRYVKKKYGENFEDYIWSPNTIGKPAFTFDAAGVYIRTAKLNLDGQPSIFSLVIHIESLSNTNEISSITDFTKEIFLQSRSGKRFTLEFETDSQKSRGKIYLGNCNEPYLLNIDRDGARRVKTLLKIAPNYIITEMLPVWWESGKEYRFTLRSQDSDEMEMKVEIASRLTWDVAVGIGIVEIDDEILKQTSLPVRSPLGEQFMNISFVRKN